VTQLLTFVNTTPVPHVMHIHLVDWKVVSRVGAVTQLEGLPQRDPICLTLKLLDALPGGLAVLFAAEQPLQEETGLKESFRVRPFETVQVMSQLTDYTCPATRTPSGRSRGVAAQSASLPSRRPCLS
jgi:FtsP/CotA-like multicopper oxidase with cupredoxin domain